MPILPVVTGGQILGPAIVYLTQKMVGNVMCNGRPPAIPSSTVLVINGTGLSGKSTLSRTLMESMPHAHYLSEHHQYIGDSGIPLSQMAPKDALGTLVGRAGDLGSAGKLVIVDHADPAHATYDSLRAVDRMHPQLLLNVLSFSPLEEVVDRIIETRKAHRQAGSGSGAAQPHHLAGSSLGLGPSSCPASWAPLGDCPHTSPLLPLVQFGAFYTGLPAPEGSGCGLQSFLPGQGQGEDRLVLQRLTRADVDATLNRLKKGLAGGPLEEVESQSRLALAYLTKALGLDKYKAVHLVPRAHYDLIIRPGSFETPEGAASALARTALQISRSGGSLILNDHQTQAALEGRAPRLANAPHNEVYGRGSHRKRVPLRGTALSGDSSGDYSPYLTGYSSLHPSRGLRVGLPHCPSCVGSPAFNLCRQCVIGMLAAYTDSPLALKEAEAGLMGILEGRA